MDSKSFLPDDSKTQFATPPKGGNGPLARFARKNFRQDGAPLLLTLALVTGVCAGVAAWLFKLAIAWVSTILTSHLNMKGMNPWLIAVPVIGICLTGLFLRKVLKVNIADGVDQIKSGMAKGHYYLRLRRIITPLIASTVTLGFGGSAGSEGPIASSGAAIGSNLGRIFGVPQQTVRMLVAIGAGAGIAAIFKAPVGGMFFVVECLAVTLTAVNMVALGIACLCGGMIAYALSGGVTDVDYHGIITFDMKMVFVSAILGVFCGLYSIYYSRVMSFMNKKMRAINKPWIRNISAGLTIGILLFLFPTLYGEGYGALTHMINGDNSTVIMESPFALLAKDLHTGPLLLVVAGILLAKCWACGATVHGGGVAGEFAPTLFAGAMAGLFFGLAVNLIPGADIPTAHCALFGMAGAMAGIIRAPFMAIFIATEMTGSYASLLPISVCAICSYFTVWMVCHRLPAMFGGKGFKL
ncbi:MAG: chloride channel protein [Muribaculaceae bacterium]|nr:chloride channel protein [Muribaculaceae bacterium]